MTTIQFLAEWALRSSIMIGSGALLLWALRVKDPSIRWAAWTAMLCASLAIPVLTAALPKLPLVLMQVAPEPIEAPVVVSNDALNPERGVPNPEVGADNQGPSASQRFDAGRAVSRPDVRVERDSANVSKPFDWARAALMIYVLVALALLLRLGFGLAMSLRLLRSSRVTGEATEGIEIRESDHVATPVALGIPQSTIVLPGDWREWDAAKLEAVLAHERSHIRRHDPAVQLLSTIHRALLWHNPMSWFLHRRIVRAAEEASDDAALAVTRDRALYAEMLLDFMQRGLRITSWQAVPMARYGPADKRIHRILDGTVLSRGVTRWSLTAILALGLPLACVMAAAHPQSAQTASLKDSSLSDAKIGERQTRAQAAIPEDSSAPNDFRPKSPVKALGKEAEMHYTERLSEEVPYSITVKASGKEMETPYTKWLSEEVPYIITAAERAAFKKLSTDEEREAFIENFWERRNPNPGSPQNEFKEEHYRRIAYANEHYASRIPGWKTDRGRIYIMYGSPDEIESHPRGGPYKHPDSQGGGETFTFPFEKWRYRYIAGIGTNIVLEFADADGDGEYRLTMDPGEKDALLHVPGVPTRTGTPDVTVISAGPNSLVTLLPSGEYQPWTWSVQKGQVVPDNSVEGGLKPLNLAMPPVVGAPAGATVVLIISIGESGKVTSTRVLSDDHGLSPQVMAAAKEWRFSPPTVKGTPVSTSIPLKVTLTERATPTPAPPIAPVTQPGLEGPKPAAPAVEASEVKNKLFLGEFHLRRGEYDEAIASFQEGLKLDPFNTELLLLRGTAIRDCKKDNELLKRALRCGAPDPAAPPVDTSEAGKKLTLGKFHLRRGEYDEAIALFQEGLNLDPSNAELRGELKGSIEACKKEEALLNEGLKCGAH